MKDLILFGVQGSGKGTVANFLIENYNYNYFETGKEIRKLAKEDSPLGLRVKEIINSGNLVSNQTVMDIVENFMGNTNEKNPIIFDGIPRKEIQRQTFNSLLEKYNREYMGVLLKLSPEKAIIRLLGRRVCEICQESFHPSYPNNIHDEDNGKLITREDDTKEAIEIRIKTYFKKTKPVIDKYQEDNKILTINADQSIKNVEEEVLLKLGLK